MDKLVSGATLELEQLRGQSDVLKRKRKLLLEQIYAEAAKQEVELQQKLETKRQKLEAEIETLESRITKLQEEERQLLTSIQSLQARLQDLSNTIESSKRQKTELDKDVADLGRLIIESETSIRDLTGNKSVLIEDVNSLEDQKSALIKLIDAKQGESEKLEQHISELVKDFEQKIANIQTQTDQLDLKLLKKMALLKDIAAKDEAMRQSLVERELSLEKREGVIKRRELIVTTGEQKLIDNADLLKL